MTHAILQDLGHFSGRDLQLFDQITVQRKVNKNEYLLEAGAVCQSVFYILSGAFFQYQTRETEDTVVDLHLEHEWMFNNSSLTTQQPSATAIKAFIKSEVIELRLEGLHALIAASNAFLQMGRLFNQGHNRTHLFDHHLDPAQKYAYLQDAKPGISKVFPVKMIASYLKIAPETLSRVRAMRRIS
ncbi:MAG: Crp/Fnr family transcriptional regulator [Niabella sp.]|nr:Crp/Fnr family transcriptional regulator [Niabella sp.]